jgi:hypothetical protein
MTEYSAYEEYLGFADFEGEDTHPREMLHPSDALGDFQYRELTAIQYCEAVGADFNDFENLEDAESWLGQNVPWITEY